MQVESWRVATVLTVYGIETCDGNLKHLLTGKIRLQQYLPFTVLKHCYAVSEGKAAYGVVATVLTVYGIETQQQQQQ